MRSVVVVFSRVNVREYADVSVITKLCHDLLFYPSI